eukprot:gene12585-16876_t
MSKKPAAAAPVVEAKEPEPIAVSDIVTASGKFTLPDGSQYEGSCKEVNGIRVREGQGTFSSGPEKYVGTWENDDMHGEGEYTFSSNAVYKGNFVKNTFQGEGTYIFPDGAKYIGSWNQNKMHGNGTYTDKDLVEFKGEFFNGLYNSGRSYISLRNTKTN